MHILPREEGEERVSRVSPPEWIMREKQGQVNCMITSAGERERETLRKQERQRERERDRENWGGREIKKVGERGRARERKRDRQNRREGERD